MLNINRLTMFDSCVDADIDIFSEILTSSYDQFIAFYNNYNDLLKKHQDSIDSVIFKKEEKIASFCVICKDSLEIDDKTLPDNIKISKNENGLCFHIHPINDNEWEGEE